MNLYKQFSKNPYYFWAVMSIMMQVCFIFFYFGFAINEKHLQGLVLKLSTLYSNDSIQTQFLLTLPLRSGTMESGTK